MKVKHDGDIYEQKELGSRGYRWFKNGKMTSKTKVPTVVKARLESEKDKPVKKKQVEKPKKQVKKKNNKQEEREQALEELKAMGATLILRSPPQKQQYTVHHEGNSYVGTPENVIAKVKGRKA